VPVQFSCVEDTIIPIIPGRRRCSVTSCSNFIGQRRRVLAGEGWICTNDRWHTITLRHGRCRIVVYRPIRIAVAAAAAAAAAVGKMNFRVACLDVWRDVTRRHRACTSKFPRGTLHRTISADWPPCSRQPPLDRWRRSTPRLFTSHPAQHDGESTTLPMTCSNFTGFHLLYNVARLELNRVGKNMEPSHKLQIS